MEILHNVPALSEITHRDLRKTSTTHGMPMPGDNLLDPKGWSKGDVVGLAKPAPAASVFEMTEPSGLTSSVPMSSVNARTPSGVKQAYTAPSILKSTLGVDNALNLAGTNVRSSVYSGIEPHPIAMGDSFTTGTFSSLDVQSAYRGEEKPLFLDPFATRPAGKMSSAIPSGAHPLPRRRLRTEGSSPQNTTSLSRIIGGGRNELSSLGTRNDLPRKQLGKPGTQAIRAAATESRARTLRIDSQPEIRIIPGDPEKTMTGTLLSRGQSVRLVLLLSGMAVALSVLGRMSGPDSSGRMTLAIGMLALAGYITYESYLDRQSEASSSVDKAYRPKSRRAGPVKSARKTPLPIEGDVPHANDTKGDTGSAQFQVVRERLGSVEGINEQTPTKNERLSQVMQRSNISEKDMREVYRPLFFAEFRDPWGKSTRDRSTALRIRLVDRGRKVPAAYEETCDAIIDSGRQCFVDELLNQRTGAYLNGQTIRIQYQPKNKVLEVSIFLWEELGDFDEDRAAWYKALGSLHRITDRLMQGSISRVEAAEANLEMIFRPASGGSLRDDDWTRFEKLGRDTGISIEVVRALSEEQESARRTRWISDLFAQTRPKRVAVSYKPHRGWQALRTGDGVAWKPEEWSRLVPSAFSIVANAGRAHFKSGSPLETLEIVDHLPMRWMPGEETMGAFAFAGWEWKTLILSTSAGSDSTNGEMFQRMFERATGIVQRFRNSAPTGTRPTLILSARSLAAITPFRSCIDTQIDSVDMELTELTTLLNAYLTNSKDAVAQRRLYVQRAVLKDQLEGLQGIKAAAQWIEETEGADEMTQHVWAQV